MLIIIQFKKKKKTELHHQRDKTQLYPAPVPPTRKLAQASYIASSTAEGRSKKTYNPAVCGTENTITES